MAEELLPCPFCGGANIEVRARKTTIVQCTSCGAFMLDYQDGVRRDPVAAWNRRTFRPAPTDTYIALKHKGIRIELTFSQEPSLDVYEFLERFAKFQKDFAPPTRSTGEGKGG